MDDKKKRLLVIVLFGVAAIAAVFLFTQPDAQAPQPAPPSAALPSPVPPNSIVNSAPPTLPKGTNGGSLAMRDIFSPPAEYAARLPSPARGASPGNGGQAFSAGPMPVLTGVIAGEGTRVAILRQGTISRSYRVGQSAGAYRVAAIGARSVTLNGPRGRVVLTIGQ